MPIPSIPNRLRQQARGRRGRRPAHWTRQEGAWRATSWAELDAQADRAAKALLAHGLGHEDRVCLLSFDRSDWAVAQLAVMRVGGVAVCLSANASRAEIAHVIAHTKATLVVVDDLAQWTKLAAVRADLPRLRRIVALSAGDAIHDDMVWSWSRFLSSGEAIGDARLAAREAAVTEDDLALVVYTSTVGLAEGVMFTQGEAARAALEAAERLRLRRDDVFYAHLPMSHVTEQGLTIAGAVTVGFQVYFAANPSAVLRDIHQIQPTLLSGGTAFWVEMAERGAVTLAAASPPRQGAVAWAMGVCRRIVRLGERAGLGSRVGAWLARRLALGGLRRALGLARLRHVIAGPAPLPPHTKRFFEGLSLTMHEVRGRTGGSLSFSQKGPSGDAFRRPLESVPIPLRSQLSRALRELGG